MSRHEGVSCDSCLKGNFRGKRYKCLICYDYDLCAACYEAGATNTRHNVDHPMQCILTRSDYELYYGGEALANIDQPQSYTCPYCSRMGFTDTSLQEHVVTDHADISFEVVCPVCAAMPGGDPNLMTDDFAAHLMLEHRTGLRDLISFLDEPVSRNHNMRRIPHHLSSGRGGQSSRPRRSNMHFSSAGTTSLSPSSRETVDPIAELLSQLSGVRRSASNTNSNTPTQLQQLQMQLQLERQQVNVARQQLERLPRRQIQNPNAIKENATTGTTTTTGNGGIVSSFSSASILNPIASSQTNNLNATPIPPIPTNFLLAGLLDEMSLNRVDDETRLARSLFVHDLILSVIDKGVKGEKSTETSQKE